MNENVTRAEKAIAEYLKIDGIELDEGQRAYIIDRLKDLVVSTRLDGSIMRIESAIEKMNQVKE